jgi:hypothetical protein
VRALEEAALVVAVFFGVGIAMGVFLVMAMPALRQRRYVRRPPPDEAWPLPPAPPGADGGPRWPGGGGSPG